jgi:pyridinium-3,5-biscarboxylic acid mononucleotide sulfurtransferase
MRLKVKRMVSPEKIENLKRILTALGSVAVAYSGGIDSTLLLKISHDCLGERAVALTAVSPSLPAFELDQAQAIARQIGARHILIHSQEVDDPRYQENTPSRCFFCKSEVYTQLVQRAGELGLNSVVDGTNADDASDHRPGLQAARQNGVRSPLQEAGLCKEDIRQLGRQLGLPNWDKPAAACLSSRIPYGTRISLAMLSQVEQAERILRDLGLGQLRVRHHDQIARIEVEVEDFDRLLANRQVIVSAFQQIGYQYVTLDLAGFRSGSLNEILHKQRSPHGRREDSRIAD